MKRVYISLPISGTTDYKNRGKVLAFELYGAGYKPVLPYETFLPASAPWLCHVIVDTIYLLTCSIVYFDTAWWGSKGCKWEYKVAVWSGKIIIT
jgi:hypothetical protein